MSEKILFAIDAGHHDKQNQGVIKSYYEGNAMWILAGYLVDELKKHKDIEVINTRKSINEKPNAYQRGANVAQMTGYDKIIYLTLHSNASGGNAAGAVTFRSIYKPDNQTLGDKLAQAISDVMKPKTKVTYSWGCLAWENKKYKGYDYHDNMRGIMLNAGSKEAAKNTNITYGLIIEHGFHDNKIECDFLLDNNNLKAIAEAEAKVLRDYFGLKVKDEIKPMPIPFTPIDVDYRYYTVKSGDSWWGIANKELGDYRKKEELAKFNGMTLATVIHPKQVIKIPTKITSTTTPTTPTAPVAKDRNYIVKKGDSWWGIAQREMGSWTKQLTLAKYNGKTIFSMIYPGDILKIPQ